LVSRGCLGFGNVPRRCTSKVTYQVCLIDCSNVAGHKATVPRSAPLVSRNKALPPHPNSIDTAV
jgi:hypothetical protein